MSGEVAPAQAEHRVRLVEGLGHRKLGVGGVQRGGQALDQVGGQEGRVAGRGDDQRMSGARERRMQAGERAGEAADVVAEHRVAEGLPGLEVLVGVDDQLVDLWGEARERVRRHRPAGEFDQAFVDAAHAAALAAGEQHAGDAAFGGARRSGGRACGVVHRVQCLAFKVRRRAARRCMRRIMCPGGRSGFQSRSKRSSPENSR